MWWIPAQILASRFECTSRWSTPWFSHLLAKLRLPWNAYSTLVPIVFDKQPIWSDAGSFEVRHSRPSPPYFTWKTIRASISPCAPHTYAIAPIIGLDIIKFRRRPCSVHNTGHPLRANYSLYSSFSNRLACRMFSSCGKGKPCPFSFFRFISFPLASSKDKEYRSKTRHHQFGRRFVFLIVVKNENCDSISKSIVLNEAVQVFVSCDSMQIRTWNTAGGWVNVFSFPPRRC